MNRFSFRMKEHIKKVSFPLSIIPALAWSIYSFQSSQREVQSTWQKEGISPPNFPVVVLPLDQWIELSESGEVVKAQGLQLLLIKRQEKFFGIIIILFALLFCMLIEFVHTHQKQTSKKAKKSCRDL